jgi:hypothetical protein
MAPQGVQDHLEKKRTLIRVRHLQKKSQEWTRNSQERMKLGTRRMGTLLLFPFHLLVIAREPLGSLKVLTLKEEMVLATFATIVPPALGEDEEWQEEYDEEEPLKFPTDFSRVQRKETPIPETAAPFPAKEDTRGWWT